MEKYDIKIEVHGPTQILPNATQAVQNFYGDELSQQILNRGSSGEAPLTEAEERLSIYINNIEHLKAYVASLRACRSAAEVGEVVATMCDQETGIDSSRAVKEVFIAVLLPFLTGFERGKGIDNLRVQINEALASHRRSARGRRF